MSSAAAATGRVRVLMLIDQLFPASGGAERFAVGLAAHLPRDRFQTVVCASRFVQDPWVEFMRDSGVPWFALGRRRHNDVWPFVRLLRFLVAQRVDVLHAHMFGSNVWGSLLGSAAGVPVVIAHEQTWDYQGRPLRKFLDGRVIGRLADAFVAVSTADRDRMIRLEKVPPDKVVLELNAYVPNTRKPKNVDLRADLGLAPDAALVGCACLFRPQKALSVLVDAFAEVRSDAHLVLIGDGECRQDLERQVDLLALRHRVHFLGLRSDADGLLADLDVAALSSDFEGTPLFGFECMAASTPIVATAVGGLPDMLEHGRSALFVPPRNPRALADAIDALLADPQLRRRLAHEAHMDLKGHEMSAVAQRYAKLYERLLDERPRRDAARHRPSGAGSAADTT
jgi:glycosyltransferase involved in cell wall biosynthesis